MGRKAHRVSRRQPGRRNIIRYQRPGFFYGGVPLAIAGGKGRESTWSSTCKGAQKKFQNPPDESNRAVSERTTLYGPMPRPLSSPLPRGQANLNWHSDSSATVTGYRCFAEQRQALITRTWTSALQTSYNISVPTNGKTYYFAVAAYGAAGDRSVYFNEVSKTMPITQDTQGSR